MDNDRTTARLTALSALVGERDLAVMVLDLARSALTATPSFLAMHITLEGAERPISITASQHATRTPIARSSLRLEIATTSGPEHHHEVVFLAEQPDVFLDCGDPGWWAPDLTASAARAGHRVEAAVVDADLPTDVAFESAEPTNTPDPAGDQRSVDRAVGVLMNCGYTVDTANTELGRRAVRSERTPAQQAQELLLSLRADPHAFLGGLRRQRWASPVPD